MGELLNRALRIKGVMKPLLRDAVNDEMCDFCNSVVKEIICAGKWHDSDITRQCEHEIIKIQKDVLSGRGKLIDFKEACLKWKKAGTK